MSPIRATGNQAGFFPFPPTTGKSKVIQPNEMDIRSFKNAEIDRLNEEQRTFTFTSSGSPPELVEGDRRFILNPVAEEEEVKEVYGVCDCCGMEGKFFGEEGEDWTCPPCAEGRCSCKTYPVVRGTYTTEIYWNIPSGMDLDDFDTFEYGDKWGILYITNKKTGEEWKIEGTTRPNDQKRCDEMESIPFTADEMEEMFGDDWETGKLE